jgi:type VI secretion system protein ImpA
VPLRDDLLSPIVGDSPSGVDLRYVLYDRVQEARREDDDLAQGDWQHERKIADYPLVINLTQEALATKSKDLQLAAWLTEALLKVEGFSGLHQGLVLCRGLLTEFWDTVYPEIEEGDLDRRAKPLVWLGLSLEVPVKSTPIVTAGYDWYRYNESRAVGYETQTKTDKEKKVRTKLIADGKLAPEIFDKAFTETPKSLLAQSEKHLDASLVALKDLDAVCTERFSDDAPTFSKLRQALEEVRHTVHALLEKKREQEPDPVEDAGPSLPAEADATSGVSAPAEVRMSATEAAAGVFVPNSYEPADRRDPIAAIANAAAFLRKREPHSPAPYLMMRGLRWGELRSAGGLSDVSLLEAPPTELRQQVKRLAIAKRWEELLDVAERAMSLPCSRAWLDLQRMVVGACAALGSEYEPIAAAIQSELRALLNDVPELLDANLLDDTPAANAETKAWLRQLTVPDSSSQDAAQNGANGHGAALDSRTADPSWLTRAADPYVLAQDALKAGQAEKAFAILQRELARQRSGRGRFQRTMQLIELCVEAGKDSIAQPLLEDITAMIETHKLEDWEDKAMVAAALATIMRVSKKVQGNASERQKLFDRICRLDPVQALSAG